MAKPSFKANLHAFVGGDPTRSKTIDITDAGVEKLVKAYPRLAVVRLQGTCNLKANALPAILKTCTDIQAVTITVANGSISERTRLNMFMEWLVDRDFVPGLRYLEFRGVFQKFHLHTLLNYETKCRPAIEIMYEWDGRAVLVRDFEDTPLLHWPDQSATTSANSTQAKSNLEEEVEEDWEDEMTMMPIFTTTTTTTTISFPTIRKPILA
jgi:hypothetical protein